MTKIICSSSEARSQYLHNWKIKFFVCVCVFFCFTLIFILNLISRVIWTLNDIILWYIDSILNLKNINLQKRVRNVLFYIFDSLHHIYYGQPTESISKKARKKSYHAKSRSRKFDVNLMWRVCVLLGNLKIKIKVGLHVTKNIKPF